MTGLIMECHDRADGDTSRGRDECLRVNTAPGRSTLRQKEVKLKTVQPARGRNSSPQPEHSQLREHGAAREDSVSNMSNDPERALRSYVQQFQKLANHSPGGAASSTRSSKDENRVKFSRQPSSTARRERQITQRAADTAHDGLSQRRRSYGSNPRDEARDESAVQADDESASTA